MKYPTKLLYLASVLWYYVNQYTGKLVAVIAYHYTQVLQVYIRKPNEGS